MRWSWCRRTRRPAHRPAHRKCPDTDRRTAPSPSRPRWSRTDVASSPPAAADRRSPSATESSTDAWADRIDPNLRTSSDSPGYCRSNRWPSFGHRRRCCCCQLAPRLDRRSAAVSVCSANFHSRFAFDSVCSVPLCDPIRSFLAGLCIESRNVWYLYGYISFRRIRFWVVQVWAVRSKCAGGLVDSFRASCAVHGVDWSPRSASPCPSRSGCDCVGWWSDFGGLHLNSIHWTMRSSYDRRRGSPTADRRLVSIDCRTDHCRPADSWTPNWVRWRSRCETGNLSAGLGRSLNGQLSSHRRFDSPGGHLSLFCGREKERVKKCKIETQFLSRRSRKKMAICKLTCSFTGGKMITFKIFSSFQ